MCNKNVPDFVSLTLKIRIQNLREKFDKHRKCMLTNAMVVSKMKTEYETEIVTNMQHWVIEVAIYAIFSDLFLIMCVQ